MLTDGGEQPGFDDSAWPTSTDAGVNGVDPWGIREVSAGDDTIVSSSHLMFSSHLIISPDAHWIWSEGTGVDEWKNGKPADETDDNHACCRFVSDHKPINCNAARQVRTALRDLNRNEVQRRNANR